MKFKICTHCYNEKEVSCFSKKIANKDGLKNSCKDCDKAYKVKNALAISLQVKEKRLVNINFAKKEAEKQALWRKKNPKARSEYYIKNKEKENRLKRAWVEKNIEQSRKIKRKSQRKRRDLKKGLIENFTVNDEIYIKNLFHCKCYKCGSPNNLSIDHHKPLSKGFPLKIGNAVLLCRSCNSSKRDKDPKDFYTTLEHKKLKQCYGIV